MRTDFFLCIFVLRIISGSRVKFVDNPTPAVVYATDRSKAVVPVFLLFCVALWFILRGASCFKILPCSLSSCFVIPFSIGEEGACLCASRTFVLHVLVFVLFLFRLA